MRGITNITPPRQDSGWQYAIVDGTAVDWCVYRIIGWICYVTIVGAPTNIDTTQINLPNISRPTIVPLEVGGIISGEIFSLTRGVWRIKTVNNPGYASFSYPVYDGT